MATPCATAQIYHYFLQLQFPLKCRCQWNITSHVPLHFMRGLSALVPCKFICSELCQYVSASMSPSQIKVKIKVILILAAECGRLPSPKVHSLNHSHVKSNRPPFQGRHFFKSLNSPGVLTFTW